jgi:hypothetical protein
MPNSTLSTICTPRVWGYNLCAAFLSSRACSCPDCLWDMEPFVIQIRPLQNSTHLAVKDAARRYSPAAVIAVSRDVISGVPAEISTSYVERSNLSIRMGSRRFTRLTNGFSKKLDNHAAAVSLYVAHYNMCRPHEALRTTPAVALGIADRVWSIGDLLDAVLAMEPPAPTETAPDRRRRFRVIEGGKEG